MPPAPIFFLMLLLELRESHVTSERDMRTSRRLLGFIQARLTADRGSVNAIVLWRCGKGP